MAKNKNASKKIVHRPMAHHKTPFIDGMAYTVGVLGNLAVVPQIVRAWQDKAPGLAIMTWLLFIAIGFIWLAYAIKHRQRPLIIAQSVCVSMDFLVVLGWLVHNRPS